jgi:putative membrane protein
MRDECWRFATMLRCAFIPHPSSLLASILPSMKMITMKNRVILLLAVVVPLIACSNISDRARLNDADIAMVIRVSNLSEVREGQLARDKATDTAVRAFAQMMVTDHTAASNTAEADLARAEIPSEDSQLSRQIDASSGTATEALRASAAGRDFDRAYMNRQLEVHQYILSVIDQTLVPRAHAKALKKVLTDMRKTIQDHLTRAQQIQSNLAR